MDQEKLQEICKELGLSEYSFCEAFIDIIVYKTEGYEDSPIGFFNDLQHGGCISGMIGDFIYNSDCKKFYIKHLDDLEEFKSNMEGEFEEPIQNRHKVPHYTFLCWLCFEEFCFTIGRHLYPDEF